MQAHDTPTALPFRPHNILGVCEAIGEDFGLSPMWLRVPFAASVLISPTMAIAAYFALGVIVLATRLLFPKAKTVVAADADAKLQAAAPANDPAKQDLPIAA